ncbi:RNA-binding S4 domain-containing protein [Ottowia sp.]|uniref:RNA-binding S4 domain-containing protein n=1 Tax=Ottowia sp. TaxID=1898956 RepID=UPI003A8BC67A
MATSLQRQRIDKWLWAARFYKTRALAVQAIERGRVLLAGQAMKPAREVKSGDVIEVHQPQMQRTVIVRGLSAQRGPAPVAEQLYEETPESVVAREQAAARQRLAPEPAHTIDHGRPTKRDRRDIDRTRRDWGSGGDWDERWSAQLPRNE